MNAGDDDDDAWLRGGAPSQVVPAQSSCLPLAVGLEEPHSLTPAGTDGFAASTAF